MRTASPVAPFGALVSLVAVAAAQGTPVNWAVSSQPSGNVYFSAPALFSLGGPPAADATGSIRKCYGIDQTQGGSNQDGTFANPVFRVIQASGPAGPDGVVIGTVSVQSASVPSSSGDACFSPHLPQPGLRVETAAIAPIGRISGTTSTPFPTFYAVVLNWLTPVEGPTVLGTDASGLPLLANVIFEVQGPLNDGSATQYYLATTNESEGLATAGPGGVANGNPSLATALLGQPPWVSSAVSHTRVTGVQGGTAVFATMPFGTPGRMELRADLAFETPQLWAQHDGDFGAGGPDWRVSGPVSSVDLRMLDFLAGAQSTPGDPAFDPCLAFNGAIFLWSVTPATAMLQQPMSWDSVGWPLQPPQPGSKTIGPVPTKRAGFQTVPANFDAVTAAFLATPALTLGTSFTPLNGLASVFQGGFTPITDGISTLASGPLPLLPAPAPALAGIQLGIAAAGVQLDGCVGALELTEFATSLQVSLQ